MATLEEKVLSEKMVSHKQSQVLAKVSSDIDHFVTKELTRAVDESQWAVGKAQSLLAQNRELQDQASELTGQLDLAERMVVQGKQGLADAQAAVASGTTAIQDLQTELSAALVLRDDLKTQLAEALAAKSALSGTCHYCDIQHHLTSEWNRQSWHRQKSISSRHRPAALLGWTMLGH